MPIDEFVKKHLNPANILWRDLDNSVPHMLLSEEDFFGKSLHRIDGKRIWQQTISKKELVERKVKYFSKPKGTLDVNDELYVYEKFREVQEPIPLHISKRDGYDLLLSVVPLNQYEVMHGYVAPFMEIAKKNILSWDVNAYESLKLEMRKALRENSAIKIPDHFYLHALGVYFKHTHPAIVPYIPLTSDALLFDDVIRGAKDHTLLKRSRNLIAPLVKEQFIKSKGKISPRSFTFNNVTRLHVDAGQILFLWEELSPRTYHIALVRLNIIRSVSASITAYEKTVPFVVAYDPIVNNIELNGKIALGLFAGERGADVCVVPLYRHKKLDADYANYFQRSYYTDVETAISTQYGDRVSLLKYHPSPGSPYIGVNKKR